MQAFTFASIAGTTTTARSGAWHRCDQSLLENRHPFIYHQAVHCWKRATRCEVSETVGGSRLSHDAQSLAQTAPQKQHNVSAVGIRRASGRRQRVQSPRSAADPNTVLGVLHKQILARRLSEGFLLPSRNKPTTPKHLEIYLRRGHFTVSKFLDSPTYLSARSCCSCVPQHLAIDLCSYHARSPGHRLRPLPAVRVLVNQKSKHTRPMLLPP